MSHYTHDCRGIKILNLQGTRLYDFYPDLTSVSFINAEDVTAIGDGFLWSCQFLQSVDLSPLNKVTRVGNDFLWGCTSLESIDLSPLSNVTKIGDAFLGDCDSLTLTKEQKQWIKERQ